MKSYKTLAHPLDDIHTVEYTILNAETEVQARELANWYTWDFEWIREPFDPSNGRAYTDTKGLEVEIIKTTRLIK